MAAALQASLKAAAVGGIFMVWAKITIEAFKFSWHIISIEDETLEPVVKQRAICEECSGYFWDDGRELKYGMFLCESCSDHRDDN